MVLLDEAVSSKKLDVRMVERNIARGVIRSEDVDQALQTLPDDAENADWVNLDELMSDSEDGESRSRQSHPEH